METEASHSMGLLGIVCKRSKGHAQDDRERKAHVNQNNLCLLSAAVFQIIYGLTKMKSRTRKVDGDK